MKVLPTLGLVLQVTTVFISYIYGARSGKKLYKEAKEALSKEVTESIRTILDTQNTPSLKLFDDLVSGAETLMIYLNHHTKFEHDSFESFKDEIRKAINKMNDETQKCLKAYGDVVQRVRRTVSVGKQMRDEDYIEDAKRLQRMKNLLSPAKDQYLNICVPNAFTAAAEDLKSTVTEVIESEELRNSLAAGHQDDLKTPQDLQNEIDVFLMELEKDAAEAIDITRCYKPIISFGGKYSKSRQVFRQRIAECQETAKEMFLANLNKSVLYRLSTAQELCVSLFSLKCKFIFVNIVSPSLELFKDMLDKKKTEVKGLFKICIDGAVLETTQKIR